MLSWNIVVVIHIYTSTPTLLSPPLMLPSSIRRSRVQTRPHPGAVMEWWSGQGWQGCDSHWAQSSLYIGSRSKVRSTITQRGVSWSSGWLQRFVFGSQTLCQFYFQPNEHSKVFGIIWYGKSRHPLTIHYHYTYIMDVLYTIYNTLHDIIGCIFHRTRVYSL